MAQKNTFFESLSRVWGGSCVIRPDYTPSHLAPGCGLGNRATQLLHRTVGFLRPFPFRPADRTPLGAGGDLGILATLTVARNCTTFRFIFRWYNFASSTSSLGLWRYFGFLLFHLHIVAPSPLLADMAAVFLDIFPAPYGEASFLSLFSWSSLSAS